MSKFALSLATAGATFIGLAAIATAAVASGIVPLPIPDDGNRPPCSQLPTTAQVQSALDTHRAIAARVRQSAPSAAIGIDHPCTGQPALALIKITVPDDSARGSVEQVLRTGLGFGAPVILRIG